LTPVGCIHSIIALRQAQPNSEVSGHFQSRNVTKDDLSKAVHDIHGGMSHADAQKIVDLILDTIKQRLAKGEKVVISGFGCFRVATRKDRRGVNPRTGSAIVIPGRKAVTFRPSKYLKSL
jgi:nucleoid DNA-binding protein